MNRILVCGAAAVGAILLSLLPATAQVNDLACFAVKDHSAKGRFEARLGGAEAGVTCKVKMPAKLACVRTSATTSPPMTGGDDVSTDVLCYRAKCTQSTIGTMQMSDAVGQHAVRMRAGKFLCLPATSTGATPAPTTTTTVPGPCEFRDGGCRGSCAGGGRCGAVVGTGACECRTTSCGDASAPECDGVCSDPTEACIFDVTGCSCVRIP
jgi:hypothetical protein